MPSRNLEKIYATDAFYHIYNRGVEKRIIFNDTDDYAVFLSLFKRYLDVEPAKDVAGRDYPHYRDQIKLLAFCLMSNHFHLLIYQKDKGAMTRLLRGVCTAYTMYFNKKYQRVGHLFQSRFKASMITNDTYLQHISRYIHLNTRNYESWQFSSLPYYLGRSHAMWIDPLPILDLFEKDKYAIFLRDFISYRNSLKEIKLALADT